MAPSPGATLVSPESGVTLVELLAVLALIGTLVVIATLTVAPMEDPLRAGSQQVEGLIRQTRARAAATMTVHRVRPLFNGLLVVEHAAACSSGSWTADPQFDLTLPNGVTLTDTSWSICFGSRGTAMANQTLTLTDVESRSQQLEILMGGVVRWL